MSLLQEQLQRGAVTRVSSSLAAPGGNRSRIIFFGSWWLQSLRVSWLFFERKCVKAWVYVCKCRSSASLPTGAGPALDLGPSIAGPKAGVTPALPWLGCSPLGSNAAEGLTPSLCSACPNCPRSRQDLAREAPPAPGGSEGRAAPAPAGGGRGSGGSCRAAAAVSFSTLGLQVPQDGGGRRGGIWGFAELMRSAVRYLAPAARCGAELAVRGNHL